MNHVYIFMENGGWHFNALGGIEKKVEDFQHYVYNIDYMKKRASGDIVYESGLPEYIINNKEKYKELFL